MSFTAEQIRSYCGLYNYPDAPVLPATRRRVGIAVASAERDTVLHEHVRGDYPRLLLTSLYDETLTDPLVGLTVVLRPRPAARQRPVRRRHRLLRRIWRIRR